MKNIRLMTLFSLLMLGSAVVDAKSKKPQVAPTKSDISLQRAIFTVKGIPLRLSERYLKQIFPDMDCEDSSLGATPETTCEVETLNKADMNLAGYETELYRFRLSGGEIIGISVLLSNAAMDDIVTRIKEGYGPPKKTISGKLESNNDGEQLITKTMVWKQGIQILTIKNHDRDIDTMSISLSGTEQNIQ